MPCFAVEGGNSHVVIPLYPPSARSSPIFFFPASHPSLYVCSQMAIIRNAFAQLRVFPNSVFDRKYNGDPRRPNFIFHPRPPDPLSPCLRVDQVMKWYDAS